MKYVHVHTKIGCCIYKYFIYSLAWFFFISPFVLLGVIVYPDGGEWLGSSLCLMTFVFIWALGDRVILAVLQAQDLSRNRRLKNIISNYSYLLNLDNIEIYEGPVQRRDILVLQGPFKRRAIIIGSQLLKDMDQTETDVLLYLALTRFKNKMAKSLRPMTILYAPYACVMVLFEKWLNARLINSFVGFFIYPVTLVYEELVQQVHRQYGPIKLEPEADIALPRIDSALYHLQTLRSMSVEQTALKSYLDGFSLVQEGERTGPNDKSEVGVYERQE